MRDRARHRNVDKQISEGHGVGRRIPEDARHLQTTAEMPILKPGVLPHSTRRRKTVPRQQPRIVWIVLAVISLWLLLSQYTTDIGIFHVSISLEEAPIITLASSAARLRWNELAVTLRSLLHQSLSPSEIRLYLTNEDREAFEWHRLHESSRLARYLNDPKIKLHYVQDVGPSTKFMYAIKDLLDRDQGDQPLIVLDDDHSYSPDLVSTLVAYSRQEAFDNSAVGLRGWRVRSDLHWGVAPEEMDDHVAEGWRLAEPFQVGVLTANDAYLVRPKFFIDPAAQEQSQDWSQRAPLLDYARLNDSAAHLVDDIWLNGHLCKNGIPRYVVPLIPSSSVSSWSSVLLANDAIPSIDVTKAHTLEGRIQREGFTRTTANWVALSLFEKAWRAEGLFYVSKAKRKSMKPEEIKNLVPRYMNGLRLARRQLLKLFHHLQVRMIFGQ